MTPQELADCLRGMTSATFNRKHLFNSKAWFFEPASQQGVQGTYDDFRATMGEVLALNPQNIALVGSGKFGYSLGPGRGFAAFSAQSDLDVVVVSPGWFEEVWRHLRIAHFNGYPSKKDNSDDIFRKFVTLRSNADFDSTYLRDSLARTGEINRQVAAPLAITHPIKYRIYADWADVDAYHAWSTDKLRNSL